MNIHRTHPEDRSVEALVSDLEDLGMDIAAALVEDLRRHLEIVLDCYAAQVPTPGSRIEHAKALVKWDREEAEARNPEYKR